MADKALIPVDTISIATVTKLDPLKNQSTLASLVEDTHELHGANASASQAIVQVGKVLKRIHTRLKGAGRDGGFKPFVETYCAFTVKSAYNYIKIGETFGSAGIAGHLQHFDVTALHKLSSEHTPQEAVDEAIKEAKKGMKIKANVAKTIIKEYSEPKAEPLDDGLGTIPDEAEVEHTDKRGEEIPDKLIDTFDDDGFDNARNYLGQALKELTRLSKDSSLRKHMDIGPLRKTITELRTRITNGTPYALCPKCEGGTISKCTACNRAGWMPQHVLTNYEGHK